MSDEIQDRLTDHAYDGIMEYDNPTPGWWSWIFVGSIVFSIVYYLVSVMSDGGLDPKLGYAADLQNELKKQYGVLGDMQNDDASVLKLMADEKWVKVGESLFNGNCVACHGKTGGGVTGPNLTDDSWIHVKTPKDIVDVVLNGRKNGAMPAWKNTLRGPEPLLVSAYVASLRGTNASGKGPEGEKIPTWK